MYWPEIFWLLSVPRLHLSRALHCCTPHQVLLAGTSHHRQLGESLEEDVLSLLFNLLAHTSHLDRRTMDLFQDAFFTPCLISFAGKEFWTIPGFWHAASPILPAAHSTTQPIPPIYHPPVTTTRHLSGDHDSPGTCTFWRFSQLFWELAPHAGWMVGDCGFLPRGSAPDFPSSKWPASEM